MTPADLIARFRGRADDLSTPQLWSDDDLLDYMEQAQNEFAQFTGGFADAVSPRFCQLNIAIGQKTAALDPLVLNVAKAWNYQGKELGLDNAREEYDPLSINSTGNLEKLLVGATDGLLHMFRPPAVADVVRMLVYRMPEPLTGDDAVDEIQIQAQFHLGLLDGMFQRAYLKHDTQTYDPAAAKRHGEVFDEHMKFAKRIIDRQRHKPRTVAYGGL